jgi:hypothetical protein
VVDQAISFWNANVLASKLWGYPRVKELNALKKRMRGQAASREDAATFDLLTEHWRRHWLDPHRRELDLPARGRWRAAPRVYDGPSRGCEG